MHRFTMLAVSFLVVACDSNPPPAVDAASMPDGGVLPDAFVSPDAWQMPDAGFEIASHGFGIVIANQGGARLTHPELVLITFADEPNRDTLEAHARWLMSSSWLTDVGAEYGIGTGSVLATVHRTDDAPPTTTDDQIQALLAAGITDHSLPMGSDGTLANVLYVLYVPNTTTIEDSLGQSCVSYGGYHNEATAGGAAFSYAVIPNCDAFNPALSSLEFEQEAMSHEVIEAATDALPASNPAYVLPQREDSPWVFVGGELADLCALHVGPTAYIRDAATGFIATRVWSNAASRAGDRDPCVPEPAAAAGMPYYSVSVSPAAVLPVAAGSSVTFDLTGWSVGPVAPFTVFAGATTPGAGMFVPDVTVEPTTINNGEHATLTVTVPAGTPSNDYALIYVETYHDTNDFDSQPVVVFVP